MEAVVEAAFRTSKACVVHLPNIVQTVVTGWECLVELLHRELHTLSILRR
jgi:hypothetical protein